MKLSTRSIGFTEAERRAFEKRQRRTEALLQRMADSPPEESDRIAREFFHEIRTTARRRAQESRVVAIITPRARHRERRPAGTRRTASSSTTSSTDPGDPDPAASKPRAPWQIWRSDYELAGNAITPKRRERWAELQRLNQAGGLKHISEPLAELLEHLGVEQLGGAR
jgi:hypothetical protein